MKRSIYSFIITGNITLLSNINILYCDNNNSNHNNTTNTNNQNIQNSTVPSVSNNNSLNNKNALKSDCHIPACNSTKDMLKLAKQQRDKMLKYNNINNSNISNNHDHGVDHDHEDNNKQKIKHNPYKTGCPILREELGISTWKLIHTIAANYPESPSELDKQQVKQFFESLSYLYPCPHCAEDFQSSIASKPPRYKLF